MNDQNDHDYFRVTVMDASNKAIQVKLDRDGSVYWVPKSLCELRKAEGASGVLEVEAWFVEGRHGRVRAVYDIEPMGKPRQTQRDRWKRRPAVLRYHAFRDQVRLLRVQIPEAGAHITFVLPMPKSWTKRKRTEMAWKPHQQVPDADNLLKALLDAVYGQDCGVWDARVTKVWGWNGMVMVSEIGPPPDSGSKGP